MNALATAPTAVFKPTGFAWAGGKVSSSPTMGPEIAQFSTPPINTANTGIFEVLDAVINKVGNLAAGSVEVVAQGTAGIAGAGFSGLSETAAAAVAAISQAAGSWTTVGGNNQQATAQEQNISPAVGRESLTVSMEQSGALPVAMSHLAMRTAPNALLRA